MNEFNLLLSTCATGLTLGVLVIVAGSNLGVFARWFISSVRRSVD